MTAQWATRIAVMIAVIAGWATARLCRRLDSQGLCPLRLSASVAILSGILGALAAFPAAAWLARTQPVRALDGLLVIIPVVGLVTAAVYLLYGRSAPTRYIAITAAAGATVGIVLAVAAGAVGGAVKAEKYCQSNLTFVGKALERYINEKGHWPRATNWVSQLIVYLSYPRAYRCPAGRGTAYNYSPPPSDADDATPVITCPHPFLGHVVVLRKDLKVEIQPLRRHKPPSR